MSPYSFVYFDLDDTLLDHRSAERNALRDVHAHFAEAFHGLAISTFQETYHEINGDVWHRYGAGEITKEEARAERFRRVLAALSVRLSVSPDEANSYYMQRYSRYWSYVPGAREAFLKIARKFPVGILTNGFSEVQKKKMDQFLDLKEAATTVVISEDVGYLKPDRRLFDHAASLAGVPAERILYVGDSLRSDVIGGREAGWHVCWFRTNHLQAPPSTDLRVPYGVPQFSDWKELAEWLLTHGN
jgi:putative hydrolase of the HAD superfamily